MSATEIATALGKACRSGEWHRCRYPTYQCNGPTLVLRNSARHDRWFGRAWVLPPPLERKSPGAPTPRQIFASRINDIIAITPLSKEQARALAEQLFSSGDTA